jgi:hypothetical protein
VIDRSFLDPARLEFAVVADTHYLPDPGDRPVEFESRRRQAARAEQALRLTAAIAPDFVVHLGDLAQLVPEGSGFAEAIAAAVAQLERCGVQPKFVAGNQDIGDKPDPTMPTAPVTPATLAAYHARFGRSWHSWSAGPLHCIALNSQIMNSGLPEEAEQRRWLEAELAAHAGRRLVLFLHLPLYLRDERDPDLGHYDTLGQPARGWLLDLIDRYQVELVMSGHSHWSFLNQRGPTRLVVCPSTSHTRPGFSELFSSAPPPEQGRDDTGKLGITLVRVMDDGARLHLLRTHGRTAPREPAAGDLLVTRLARDLPRSPLGLTLTHPLATAGAVPLAWPSVVRQPVRNDYPLLACQELGVRYLRLPAGDLDEPLQAERLALLRAEGVALTACWLWQEALDLPAELARHAGRLDGVELQLPGTRAPSAGCLRAAAAARAAGLAVTLTPVLPGESVPGKQLRRTRIGYRPAELAELAAGLAAAGAPPVRALCRLDPTADPWQQLASAPAALPGIAAVDWALDPATVDERQQLHRTAAALFAVAGRAGSRLYLEPLLDLDRTMDAGLGLLDRQCNPRPVSNAVRCLTTVLAGEAAPLRPLGTPALPGLTAAGLARPGAQRWLLLPAGAPAALDRRRLGEAGIPARRARLIDLASATIRTVAEPDTLTLVIDHPALLLLEEA